MCYPHRYPFIHLGKERQSRLSILPRNANTAAQPRLKLATLWSRAQRLTALATASSCFLPSPPSYTAASSTPLTSTLGSAAWTVPLLVDVYHFWLLPRQANAPKVVPLFAGWAGYAHLRLCPAVLQCPAHLLAYRAWTFLFSITVRICCRRRYILLPRTGSINGSPLRLTQSFCRSYVFCQCRSVCLPVRSCCKYVCLFVCRSCGYVYVSWCVHSRTGFVCRSRRFVCLFVCRCRRCVSLFVRSVLRFVCLSVKGVRRFVCLSVIVSVHVHVRLSGCALCSPSSPSRLTCLQTGHAFCMLLNFNLGGLLLARHKVWSPRFNGTVPLGSVLRGGPFINGEVVVIKLTPYNYSGLNITSCGDIFYL